METNVNTKDSKTSETLLQQRLTQFIESGLLSKVPNKWQRLQGSYEMAPFVVIPDKDDKERYEGSSMGNPLLRTPIVLAYIGWDHFRVGSGLGASSQSLIRHLCIVHHQIMPDYDLQLLQTHSSGLEELRSYLSEIDGPSPSKSTLRHRRWIKKVLPRAEDYRREFTRPGGWIDRARAMDYTPDEQIPDHLRAEFFSLTRFLEYCLTLPPDCPAWKRPQQLLARLFRRNRSNRMKHDQKKKKH
jgi:hypothetical protein